MRRRRPRGQRGAPGPGPGGGLHGVRVRRPQRHHRPQPAGGPVGEALPGRLPGWRAVANRASTRLYGPRRGLEGFSWIPGERVAIGAVPVGDAVSRLPELGVTHVVNCRAQLQTRISQDLWAERRVFGADRVRHAPMWDHGRRQPPALWAPAARFAAGVLDEHPTAGVLIHCQQGRRRSAMVTYAVLRLRGHDPDEAERMILEGRTPASIVPAYKESVEDWLAASADPLT